MTKLEQLVPFFPPGLTEIEYQAPGQFADPTWEGWTQFPHLLHPEVHTPHLVHHLQQVTGIDYTSKSEIWDPNPPQDQLPPKALWQMLMRRFEHRTGITVGDPTVLLMNPSDLSGLYLRIQAMKQVGEAWIGCSTKDDPTNWGVNAIAKLTSPDHQETTPTPDKTYPSFYRVPQKPKLWRDIDGDGQDPITWQQFVSELEVEKQTRSNLILKTFPQLPYKILNIRMNAGSTWQNPNGWTIFVEWYETTDAREGDEIIPRSFLISSHPRLSVVCGTSTRDYACHFLENSVSSLQKIIHFWQTIHHPPAVLECMRLNGSLTHLNDLSVELPRPTGSIQDTLRNYEKTFIKPLYAHKPFPDIAEEIELNKLDKAPWVLPEEWAQYHSSTTSLANTAISESSDNWKTRARLTGHIKNFSKNLANREKFILHC